MNLEALESQAGAAKSFLKTVANERRRAILCELLAGEKSVTALRGAIGLSQSALSQHLAAARRRDRRDRPEVADGLLFAGGRSATKLIGLIYELYCAPDCRAEPRTNKRGKR
jgi:DNA-binding transcriptional ArsR family regulator